MVIHVLKLQFQFCDLVESGVKNFEIRKMDRNFHTGDLIKFHPIDQSGNDVIHSISKKIYQITFILEGWGIEKGYAALAIKEWKPSIHLMNIGHIKNLNMDLLNRLVKNSIPENGWCSDCVLFDLNENSEEWECKCGMLNTYDDGKNAYTECAVREHAYNMVKAVDYIASELLRENVDHGNDQEEKETHKNSEK
jgi:hypothetical protein